MQRDILLLTEIIEAAEQAHQLTAGIMIGQLYTDRQRHDALLWNFTLPGEAAGQLSAEVKDRFPAQWLELSSDEEAAAVAAPREFAGIGATCSPRLPEFLRARARVSLMSR
jgi:hypothetical protein